MKKAVLIGLVALACSGVAGAQKFSIGGGISGSAGSGSAAQLGFSVNLGVDDLARLGPIGVDARLDVDGTLVASTLGLSVGAAVMGTFGVAGVTVYAGPRVVYAISPVSSFGFGAILGARYSVAAGISAYAEGKFLFSPAFAWAVGVGARFSF
jgi:hypothetical protein